MEVLWPPVQPPCKRKAHLQAWIHHECNARRGAVRVTHGCRLLICACTALEGVHAHAWRWLSIAYHAMEVLWPPVQPSCKRAARCTSSHAVHVQINSLHPIRSPCCMLPRVALIVHSRLQLSPSLARRLHGRPEQPHGMLGEGQPPTAMRGGVRLHTLGTCKSTVSPPYVARAACSLALH